jgi:hypothetical protein
MFGDGALDERSHPVVAHRGVQRRGTDGVASTIWRARASSASTPSMHFSVKTRQAEVSSAIESTRLRPSAAVRVQLERTLRTGEGDGGIVADHLRSNLGEHLRHDRVDLARHDRGPAWSAGRISSPNPAAGPDAIQRTSLAILTSAIARPRSAADVSTTESRAP